MNTTMNYEEKKWGMFCHLAALAGYIIPFGNIIGPLVIWLLKKDEYPFVDDQGKESLNFQISIMLYIIIGVVSIILVIGIVILIAVGIFSLIMIIIATVKANEGVAFRYPLCIRFIK